MRGFAYLASPYSRFPGGTENAFREAANATAMLVKAGYPTLSPIVHSHVVAHAGGIDPLDCAMWLEQDEPFMEAAAGIIVLMIEGWDSSVGVTHEINRFADMGKPIVLMVPGEVPDLSGAFE
jgi:hypothetical protein